MAAQASGLGDATPVASLDVKRKTQHGSMERALVVCAP
jgi:hypothetical protein